MDLEKKMIEIMIDQSRRGEKWRMFLVTDPNNDEAFWKDYLENKVRIPMEYAVVIPGSGDKPLRVFLRFRNHRVYRMLYQDVWTKDRKCVDIEPLKEEDREMRSLPGVWVWVAEKKKF